MALMAFGVPDPFISKLSGVPATKVIMPLIGFKVTLIVELKLLGMILGFLNSALISTGVTIVPPGPGTPTAGTITVSFHETLVKALVLMSSMTPMGAVPLLTVAITWFPIMVNSAI